MAANRSSWGAPGPSYILAAARAGTTELHVGRADNLYQLASDFTIRVSLGAPNQEDFEVVSVAPLHGGADERAQLLYRWYELMMEHQQSPILTGILTLSKDGLQILFLLYYKRRLIITLLMK